MLFLLKSSGHKTTPCDCRTDADYSDVDGRPSSRLSAMNRERVRRLIAARRMTKAGLARIAHVFDHESDTKRKLEWRVPPDILAAIKQDRTTWKHFEIGRAHV